MTTTETRPRSSTGSAWRRILSLSTAEIRQFLRNKTLVAYALIFPIGIGLVIQFIGGNRDSADPALQAATSMEVFLLVALMFVQYYSVLSMATTRRDERVLKRLRTGEARDGEILTALAAPGAVVSLVLTALMTVALILLNGTTPHAFLPMLAAVILGIVISTALALLTSIITSNAEAAQMTSLPVMVLAMASQSALLLILPERVRDIVSHTPFALIGDVVFIDWSGSSLSGALTSGEVWRPLLELLPWAIVLLWLGVRYMKWETNR
ncbi:ABC transporter permease [Corynebacterium flavescens]|uniref:ABC transporter permease n=1 Tax=Corynebacterium flavescens TaxID=28028 RepID=UPI0026490A50|nr:ABC transporter permease [Corynebacterium flavescens]MDN6200447.1 ABC transporter permease [Corynebacterium flavescens]MDN6227533.1 ABC transporter permease [Corynebacterium flavescens]